MPWHTAMRRRPRKKEKIEKQKIKKEIFVDNIVELPEKDTMWISIIDSYSIFLITSMITFDYPR